MYLKSRVLLIAVTGRSKPQSNKRDEQVLLSFRAQPILQNY